MTSTTVEQRTISRAEHLQLLGLLTLARRRTAELIEIERSIVELLGPEAEHHASDAIYGYELQQTVDAAAAVALLLRRVKIEAPPLWSPVQELADTAPEGPEGNDEGDDLER